MLCRKTEIGMRTRIKGRWVVGFTDGTHHIVPDGELVYEDDTIEYVGPDYGGSVDRTIDATDHLVAPGLVNLHCVANTDLQVFRIDVDSPGFPKSTEFWESDEQVLNQRQTRQSARHALATALRTGSTTVGAITEMATKRWEPPQYEPPAMLEAFEELGLRGYVSHPFHSGSHRHQDDSITSDEDRGQAGLERAVEFAQTVQESASNRVEPYLFPYTLDSCSADLFQTAKEEADRLGVHLRTHFAQSHDEVETIQERSGSNPVFYLEDLGVLDRNVILTHGIYIAGKDGLPYEDGRDLDLLADRGVSVSHEPLVFARRGVGLESFSRYREHGINMALGTDTFPQDIICQLRWGASAGKTMEQRADTAMSRELFDAATVGGARALGRNDIGRLRPGAKADVICVDFSRLHVGYVQDPIRALVNHCFGTDVDHVIVDGTQVVEDGTVTGVDEDELVDGAAEVLAEMESTFVEWDDEGRTADELFPPAYPSWGDAE
jgi:cytosine/adenosine deaminase-related metal-dependent hydrolase